MKVELRENFSSFWPIDNLGEVTYQKPRRPSRGGAAEESWVRQVLRARKGRGAFFNPDLFADPAWDMLLKLHLAELAQQRISISSLCRASGSPATTALRWIDALQREGLVAKSKDPRDGRRIFVGLSDKGRGAMSAYLSTLPDSLFPFEQQSALAM